MRMHMLAFPNHRAVARWFGDCARCACMCSLSPLDVGPGPRAVKRPTSGDAPVKSGVTAPQLTGYGRC